MKKRTLEVSAKQLSAIRQQRHLDRERAREMAYAQMLDALRYSVRWMEEEATEENPEFHPRLDAVLAAIKAAEAAK